MKSSSLYLFVLFIIFLFSCSKEKNDSHTCMDCPVITSLSPNTGIKGDTISISGNYFATSGNSVRFNGKEAKIMKEGTTSVTAYVPSNCGTGPVTVQRPDQQTSNTDKEFTEVYTFTVSTYAGIAGSASWWDGSITYCFLNTPGALAIDREGSLIICDEKNYCLRKISNGEIRTIAGKHGVAGYQNSPDPQSALFNTPYGIAITPTNSIFISDHRNHCIRNFSPIGFVTPSCGDPQFPSYANGTGSDAHFNYPGRMLMLDENSFAVCDSANNRIRKVSIKNEVSLLAGSGAIGSNNGNAVSASFDRPAGMVLLGSKTLLITDRGNGKIRALNLVSGEVRDYAGYGKPGFFNGTLERSQFNNPSGIAVRDMNGKTEIFIADTDNNMIRMIDHKNMVTTIVGDLQPGSNDGIGMQAHLNGPADIVVDPSDNGILYVSDRKNHTIRKIVIE